ncbi:helix-turn-helix domain-containing protein [Streptomyces sp. NPDC002574]|uniref:helix-turn-helix domain-containing protein n=1 Tax=Streptomyces sp. NPDC002574 TaxID=3364652 RepID=UPI0036AEF2BF
MSQRNAANPTLGDFLRACRARVHPVEAGLPDDGRHRRVPGLRREELAQLANVSVDYVVRLEQGRTANVSTAVLQSLARALRLRPDERDYLLRIAEAGAASHAPVPHPAASAVRPQTRTLLDGWAFPAMLLGPRLDVLAWNALGAALLGIDFGALPEEERNLVRLAFLDPRFRELYTDWRHVARECVGYLRMGMAHDPEDPQLLALVEELSTADADFRRWWSDHRVRTRAVGTKSFRHPVAGAMTLDFQSLVLGDEPDRTVFVYSAQPDTPSYEALRFLATWSSSAPEAARR